MSNVPWIQEVAESHIGDSITCTETEGDENEYEDSSVAWQTFLKHPMQKAQVKFQLFRRFGISGSLSLFALRVLGIRNLNTLAMLLALVGIVQG